MKGFKEHITNDVKDMWKTMKIVLKVYLGFIAVGITSLLLFYALPASWQSVVLLKFESIGMPLQYPEVVQTMEIILSKLRMIINISFKVLFATTVFLLMFAILLTLQKTVFDALKFKPKEIVSNILTCSELAASGAAVYFIMTSHTVSLYLDRFFNYIVT